MIKTKYQQTEDLVKAIRQGYEDMWHLATAGIILLVCCIASLGCLAYALLH